MNDCCAVAIRVLELYSRTLFALGGTNMKKDDIIYTTPEEQIEKLISQHLLVEDNESAVEALELFGYSNLIKSYREPYMITVDSKKIYRSGVSFNQLVSLYMLDKNLRNAVMAAMQDLEEHIKELSSDVIASSFGTHQNKYLQYKNYRNKRKRIERFTLSGILKTMNKTLDTDKDPIHHYNSEHGIVPPWILFKSIYFSTIINFIDQFKIKEQNKLVEKLYDGDSLELPEERIRMLMMDTLFICLEYRNIAAHGGRIYNYNCHNKLRIYEIFGENNVKKTVVGFSQLLFVLSLLNYQNPFFSLSNTLSEEVNRHCSAYPQDVTYLGQILNIDIVPHTVVYISDSSNKYHKNPHCSGIKNAYGVELETAKVQGYIPCKRCAN